MHFFKKFSLVAFFVSMMTALQGCSLRDSATALLVLIAFMLPGGCFGTEEPPAAVAQSSNLPQSYFVSESSVLFAPANVATSVLMINIPVTGTFLVWFNAISVSSSAPDSSVEIWHNGVTISDSIRHQDNFDVNEFYTSSTQTRVTVSAGDQITAVFSGIGGNWLTTRSLMLLQVAP